MAILTSDEILNRINDHDIIIQPFDKKNLKANSYDLTLSNKVKVLGDYTHPVDVTKEQQVYEWVLREGEMMRLKPGDVYLFSTVEYTETHNLVPQVIARSSFARNGVNLILNGGFGDIGYCGRWTIPCFVIRPTEIIAGIPFCQIFYQTIEGKVTQTYTGKYQNSQTATPSKLHKELQKDVTEILADWDKVIKETQLNNK